MGTRWIGIVGVIVVATVAGGAAIAVHRATSASRLEERWSASLARSSDSVYRLHIGATRFSILGRSFRATAITLVPDSARLAAQRRAGKPASTAYTLSIPSLEADGIDLVGLLRGRLAAARVMIDRLELAAFLDRTGPQDPPQVAALPRDWVMSVEQPLSIDTLRIVNGTIHYAERAAAGADPGGITFDHLDITVGRVTNRPRSSGEHGSTPIDLTARLAGAGRLAVSAEYDLASPTLDFSYRGSVSHLDGTRLNATLLNLQGMRIRKGVLDSAWFAVDVKHDTATGKLTMRYHDLETELIDRVTHKRGLKKKIKTFIANNFTIRTDNPAHDGAAPKPAPVRLGRAPSMSLFEFVWKTLRQGLLITLQG